MKTYLEGFDIDTSGMILLDGSGLGKGSRATPQSMTTLLREMAQSDVWDAFEESLPIAGVDGTLKNRLSATAARGTVRAKTGTLDSATTLSGLVEGTDGKNIFFSFFTSHKPKASGGRILIDGVTAALASYARTP
jgi:D-alanyl-D-alanine carboxypeptidase/D-alanyl-D-alanine-endopeptidase (penicillin-binding protein 4)